MNKKIRRLVRRARAVEAIVGQAGGGFIELKMTLAYARMIDHVMIDMKQVHMARQRLTDTALTNLGLPLPVEHKVAA